MLLVVEGLGHGLGSVGKTCVDEKEGGFFHVLNGGGGFVGVLERIRSRSFGWCRKLGCGLPCVRH